MKVDVKKLAELKAQLAAMDRRVEEIVVNAARECSRVAESTSLHYRELASDCDAVLTDAHQLRQQGEKLSEMLRDKIKGLERAIELYQRSERMERVGRDFFATLRSGLFERSFQIKPNMDFFGLKAWFKRVSKAELGEDVSSILKMEMPGASGIESNQTAAVTNRGPTLWEAAVIAEHIYTGKKGDEVEGGWRLGEIYEVGSLRMGVYARTNLDGTVEYVIANKGTSKKGDWDDNLKQPFGGSDDVIRSIEYAQKLISFYPDAYITFVGHSKGGAEAAANAVLTNRNAILFNPASVNLGAYDLEHSEYTAEMTAYIVKGEALNTVFGDLSKPIGNVVYLPSQYKELIDNPWKENHRMYAVKQAIKAREKE